MTSEKDIRVSAAYRETATEKAPEHLDRAILDEARRAAQPPYARSRAWTRPLAWAATIALSVAIVLELTQVEDVAQEPVRSFSEDAPGPTEPKRQEPAKNVPATIPEQETAAAPVLATGRSAPAKDEAAQESRMRESSEMPAAATPESFELQDEELLRRAEKASEIQLGEDRADADVQTGFALHSAAMPQAGPGCPAEAMDDPEAWLVCIEELEAAGLDEAAAEQWRRLQEEFPDFVRP